MQSFEKAHGIENVCLVQVTTYGTDNTLIIKGLEEIRKQGGTPRGVAVIDPEKITDAELDEMHAVGIRGVRLNLITNGTYIADDGWEALLKPYADRIRRLNWVLQLYMKIEVIEHLEHVIPSLDVDIVLDHVCSATNESRERKEKGYSALLRLLRENKVYVKISGLYRLSNDPSFTDYGELVKEVIVTGPQRCVYASDWPHTDRPKDPADRLKVQENQKVDVAKFIKKCKEWCGSEEQIQKLFVDNPRALWRL